MKKVSVVVAVIVVVSWFILYSSSFACSLCVELEKKGFSPESFNKAVSEHFGNRLKVADGSGKPFSSTDGALFNFAISQGGEVHPVTATRQLRGVVFDGSINTRPAKIFVVNGINFVGIKTEKNLPVLPVRLVLPAQKERIATLRQQNVPLPQPSVLQSATQIIETSLADSPTLMSPVEEQFRSTQEKVALTNQQVKQVESKKQVRSQKYVDASVTTAAVVSGLAIPPPIGPLIAGGIILGRVGWGLFQNDSEDE